MHTSKDAWHDKNARVYEVVWKWHKFLWWSWRIQEYMKLFGRGINFYGGPGESAHKQFIKVPGQRTQRRVSEFA